MLKVANRMIERFGLARGDRKYSLNDGHMPNVRGVRVALGTGYNRVEGTYSDEKVANRNIGWETAHAFVSRRPPIPLSTIVARTHMYTHAAPVWGLSIVQGPFSVAPCPNPSGTLRFVLHRCTVDGRTGLLEEAAPPHVACAPGLGLGLGLG
jgi:hypothetical protein